MPKAPYLNRATLLAALVDAYPAYLSEQEMEALPMRQTELEDALKYLLAVGYAEPKHYEGDPIYFATGAGVSVHQKVTIDSAIHGPKYA